MAEGVREIVALPDPVGEELERRTIQDGLDLRKLRVPLGVVAVIYEARPNVTVDCAALCLKSGNAIVLRGSSYAERSNAALAGLVREAVIDAGLPEGAVELLAGDRAELEQLATRGGAGRAGHSARRRGAQGGAEGGRDGAGDVRGRRQLPRLRARRRRPRDGAADRDQREGRSPRGLQRGRDAARRRRGRRRVPARRPRPTSTPPGSSWSATSACARPPARSRVGEATEADWDTEYHGMKMAVGVVDSLAEAIEHVNRHGTGHTEAIVTADDAAATEFSDGVDAAVVFVNASTRYTDGYVFGMGAEIGNSTQKLHARGPIGCASSRRPSTSSTATARSGGRDRLGPRLRRPRRRLQPAAHRPPRARPRGGVPARPRRGPAGPDRRGAAQADRARAGAARAARAGRARRWPGTSCSARRDFEVESDGPSYSFRTLEWLSEQRPGDEIHLPDGSRRRRAPGGVEASRAGARAGAARDRRPTGDGARRGRGGARAARSRRPRRGGPDARARGVIDPDQTADRGRAPGAVPGPGSGARADRRARPVPRAGGG